MSKKVFKPYPFIFGRQLPTTGIGLSGPGGILWPIFPPIEDATIRSRIKGIPAPSIFFRMGFDSNIYDIGDEGIVEINIIPNLQRILLSGDWSKLFTDHKQYIQSYLGAELYRPDTHISEINMPTNVSPVLFFIFAWDGKFVVGGDELKVIKALMNATLPFHIGLTISGSLSTNVASDNSTQMISFSTLIFKVVLRQVSNDKKYAIDHTEWLLELVDNIDLPITVDTTVRSAPSHNDTVISCVRMQVPVYALSHPDQMGYVSCYWGGFLGAGFSSVVTVPVRATTTCQSVLGPTWLPHLTFYPLVELGKTPVAKVSNRVIDTSYDIASRNTEPGYGLISRAERGTPAEIISSDFLSYPSRDPLRYTAAFQPDYTETGIIQDSCIYPIAWKDDTNRMSLYWKRFDIMTDELYFQKMIF